MGPTLAVFCVFLGCCSNLIFLELLVKEDPGGGNLFTFSQFIFIAIEGFLFTSKCGTVTPNIGLKDYMVLVTMFFATSVLNNYAFNFNIPMPLHMIFRAGSLISNMVMGIIILKKSYTLSKYVSVLMITLGIVICTFVSGQDVKSTVPVTADSVPTTPWEDFFWWSIGLTILTVTLFISAGMGIYQEILFGRYGRCAREALFYTHLLPLPFFVLLSKDLWTHWLVAVNSPVIQVPIFGCYVPRMVLYLIGNVITQYMCISGVFVLTTECASLTVTLVTTLRKFVSLLISIVYFQNQFTTYHWFGTILVFVGTLIFTEAIKKVRQSIQMLQSRKKVD